jgi:DNA invertase Pin-like site-specific DNA recombinase
MGMACRPAPGFIALMRAAAARLFDVVVAEDMDRIFRDQADYHAARKELDFLGITIHTATGKVTKIDGALRALMGEMYLENLALHVRRGLEGTIRDGRHADGRAYGYFIVPGSPGDLVIDDAQAKIVQQIFARFVAGVNAANLVEQAVEQTTTHFGFPDIHWRKIRTNNSLERIMKEIRQRPRWSAPFQLASPASRSRESCSLFSAACVRLFRGDGEGAVEL